MSSHADIREVSRLDKAPVLALGFRPFYLLAAIFAVIALPVWIGSYLGTWAVQGEMTGLVWHMHEMVFGFAPAVMAGFLLTAVRNWTGLPTSTGSALAALAALWIAGRVLIFTGPMPVAAVIDMMFLPALGAAIAVPIWHSRNTRNFKVLAIVAALTLINGLFHLGNLGVLTSTMLTTAPVLALDVIAILLAVMAGRVIPAFTNNAIQGANAHCDVRLDVVAIGSLILIVFLEISSAWWQIPRYVWISVLGVAALSHAVRLALWAPQRTIRQPLLFMLPVAYAWLPIALALGVLAHLGAVPRAIPVHALTIGAMSGLMMAMMMRSALGHSGRGLSAGWAEIAAFVALQLAALVRVLATLLVPGFYRNAVIASGVLWTLAFIVFVIAYWPVLTRPRIDGRPG
ncbi:MAG: NnrS family protein [Gammaproteobacteria bacterium]|nr:NnrS family protein [Gammaproteobacteria bacterium]